MNVGGMIYSCCELHLSIHKSISTFTFNAHRDPTGLRETWSSGVRTVGSRLACTTLEVWHPLLSTSRLVSIDRCRSENRV